jgi:hypothetical protein
MRSLRDSSRAKRSPLAARAAAGEDDGVRLLTLTLLLAAGCTGHNPSYGGGPDLQVCVDCNGPPGGDLARAGDLAGAAPDLRGADLSSSGVDLAGRDLGGAHDLAGLTCRSASAACGMRAVCPGAPGGCCAQGEWCANGDTCRCGNLPACSNGDVCSSPVIMLDGCGSACCRPPGCP